MLNQFITDPNLFTQNAVRTSRIEHQDGATERWNIILSKDFSIFVDCGLPAPWSSSQNYDYYSIVAIIGYDVGADKFYLP